MFQNNSGVEITIVPAKKWWKFWNNAPRKLEENHDFFVHNGCITFYKSPNKDDRVIVTYKNN